jgi:formate dehydrogenase major subunit
MNCCMTFWQRTDSPQPFSPATLAKHSRLRGATAVNGVCPYCAVGCAQLVYVKDGQCIDIEGDPRSPINAGTLCPKGANTFQLNQNPHRPARVLHRAPFATDWHEVSLDWAMDRIAQLTKATRDATFVDRDADGDLIRNTTAIGHLGGATLDNEENYLIKKLFNSLGIVAIENQARI